MYPDCLLPDRERAPVSGGFSRLVYRGERMVKDEIIERDRELAVKTLSELVSIKSVQSDPASAPDGTVYPFGSGVQDAFSYMLDKGREYGFSVLDDDRFGGHIEFGSGDEIIGILAHLDVVPAGDGWSFDPFSGDIRDGRVYGRGTTDDKGPLIASFFAMKALKESGFVPGKRIRLILGLDEERGWTGMHHYLEHVGAPDAGFTPDADFPVLYGEKGILHFSIAKKLQGFSGKGLSLRKLSGGTAENMVPPGARAIVNHSDSAVYAGIRRAAENFTKETGHSVTLRPVGRSLEITAEGVSAHASMPEKGLNAVAILFDFLGRLDFADDGIQEFLEFFNSRIGYGTDGSGLGIDMADEDSGSLTLNTGLCAFNGKVIEISCDVRYPVTAAAEEVYARLQPCMEEYGLGVVRGRCEPPIFTDKGNPLVKDLMEVYRNLTGDFDSEPLVIGGGTFARACPNIVAFGGHFPDEPDLTHQSDESIAVESIYKMTEIYAAAIEKLCSPGSRNMAR